ncbi:hypothetical protein FQN57_007100 [Myotisia sp. PD_48]|nr:hypothetical protein FQN57_007100 [Myotisia sp. PD_48]
MKSGGYSVLLSWPSRRAHLLRGHIHPHPPPPPLRNHNQKHIRRLHQQQPTPPNKPAASPPSTTPAASIPSIPEPTSSLRSRLKNTSVGRAIDWYSRTQTRRPYWTQFISTLIIYLCGDLSAQLLVPANTGDEEQDRKSRWERYDPLRTLRHLTVGGISSVPNYIWFMFLHNNFNFASKPLSILTKVVVSQSCFTPVFNTYFFSMQSLLSGASLEETWERVKKALPVSLVNSVKLWPAITAFMFLYVDPQFRSIFAGGIAVGWQTYLSWLNQKAAREVEEKQNATLDGQNHKPNPNGVGSVIHMGEALDSSINDDVDDDTSDSDRDSDYGPDFSPEELEALDDLIERAADGEQQLDPSSDTDSSSTTRSFSPLPNIEGHEYLLVGRASQPQPHPAVHATNHDPTSHSRPDDNNTTIQRRPFSSQLASAPGPNTASNDARSPLERLRPQQRLTVSDFVAPAWCEIQYSYSLSNFGRIRKTRYMKRGTAIHKLLEEQIHTPVAVDVATKEDAWAIRLWNVIESLRTLRATGLTREMEVWGKIDGILIGGKIDMLSRGCPDPEFELSVSNRNEIAPRPLAKDVSPATATATSLDGELQQTKTSSTITQPDETDTDQLTLDQSEGMIYLTDMKYKDLSYNFNIPNVTDVKFRPVRTQLQFYYHLLSRFITSDDVTIDDIANRHGLDSQKTFSSEFVAQIGEIYQEGIDMASSAESQDPLTVISNHNTLSRLWQLMKDQIRYTFLPLQAPSSATPSRTPLLSTLLSPILTVSYITETSTEESPSSRSKSPTTDDYHLIGSRSFVFDPDVFYPYLLDEVNWWRGRRPVKGVSLEEAWKCRFCEFKDTCSWRLAMERSKGRS